MFPSHVMPRRLLIRGAQPLIPCTPLSRYRRYKSPCRAIFCLLSREHRCWDHLSYSSLHLETIISLIFRSTAAITTLLNPPAAKATSSCTLVLQLQQRTALPLSYLPATVEISLESPRAITGSYGGSTPVSTYQTDNNNSSSQSSRTHLLDIV